MSKSNTTKNSNSNSKGGADSAKGGGETPATATAGSTTADGAATTSTTDTTTATNAAAAAAAASTTQSAANTGNTATPGTSGADATGTPDTTGIADSGSTPGATGETAQITDPGTTTDIMAADAGAAPPTDTSATAPVTPPASDTVDPGSPVTAEESAGTPPADNTTADAGSSQTASAPASTTAASDPAPVVALASSDVAVPDGSTTSGDSSASSSSDTSNSPAPAPVFAAPFSAVANAGAAAQALLAADSGITIVGNAQLNAASHAVALYDGSVAGLNIGSGLLLTSGAVPGTVNTMVGFGVDNGRVGDVGLNAVLEPIFHTPSYDAASLSFTFTVDPTLNANSVSFNIVFGSEEFPEWVDSFVDAAAVWVNGSNYAMFNHDTYSPLSVVSQNVAAGYYIDNADGHLATEYDGVSRLLKITAPIHAGENTIRIAIADTGDHILDSGIFIADLKAGTSNGTGVTAVDDQGSSLDDSAYGSGMAEYFDLSSGDDSLTAGAGDDIVDGGTGNDDMSGDDGNDAISGGEGDDSARYHGNQADFAVSLLADGNFQVVDLRDGSPEGTDVLSGVEKLHFDDGTFYIESLLGDQAPALVTASPASGDATAPVAPAVDTPAADTQAALDEQAALDAQAAAEELAALEAIATAQAQAALDEQAALDAQAAAEELAALEEIAAAQAQAAIDEQAALDAQAAEETAAAEAAAAVQAAADAAAAQADAEAAAAAEAAAKAAAAEAAAAELAKQLAGLTVTGTGGNDKLVGNLGSDTLDGGLGADSMAGGAGSDTYYVDDKKDVVTEAAGQGNDTVFATTSTTLSANVENIILAGSGSIDASGNALDNILTGNVGKNVLSGGAGNDVIEGGGGIDQLTGGSGNDYFVFSSVSDSLVGKKHDVITDFEQGDIIDLSDIDAIIGTSTDDAFSYIGASAFSQEAGQLQFNAATGNLSGDVNGDGKADFEIHLNGMSSLAFDSFQL